MKKIVSIVLSFTLLFTLFGCSNSKYTKFSKSFLNLFDTASSITAYDTSQAEFNKKYNIGTLQSQETRYITLPLHARFYQYAPTTSTGEVESHLVFNLTYD